MSKRSLDPSTVDGQRLDVRSQLASPQTDLAQKDKEIENLRRELADTKKLSEEHFILGQLKQCIQMQNEAVCGVVRIFLSKLSRYTSLCILHRNSTLNSAVTSTTKWSSYNVTEATTFAKRASIDARILRIFMKKSQIAMLQRSHAQSAGTNLSIIFMVH